ncbi:Bug family tripartite tricarboxylate transporter substrate binding protein [Variovorax ginsengisoli]|uniref:Tripartite tricarboxylate transporter substrate binding protein n=1 Tax=Variovorax ginsengisoli TaxID=363844 RepID=A0ABT8SEY0_9BURK|nr:tripartite tricarboxylate transporter substrate binding protein [Variovorax ginsengisoli]MDN8618304.1 tripartite tricarboxylate transporter substrate binding protein [Variovorax ginsengisoli]MDO1537474.1 tripartite tricarboxylate transporter substrate binding protein [Variovorax ginsengisoli]
MTTRRSLLRLGASLAAVTASAWVRTQPADVAFPQRPVFLWVPWSAGGGTDLSLRVLAELAGRRLGQPIVIENRGGAGGTLAMPILQQSLPDGYTLAQMPQPVFRAPWTQKVAWDPIRDTTPIIQVSGVTFGLLVPAASPLRSVADLLAHAAADPGRLTIATNGVGTTPHVVLDALFAARGLSFIHVPYKGAAEQLIALSSGQVMAGVNANGFAPFVDSGRLRLLATFGAARSRRWPDVPTMSELGHGIVAMSPYGLAGPRGMPDPIVRRLHDAFKSALFDPRHIAELAKYDQEVVYLDSADYGLSMREAYAAEKRTVERLGLGPA